MRNMGEGESPYYNHGLKTLITSVGVKNKASRCTLVKEIAHTNDFCLLIFRCSVRISVLTIIIEFIRTTILLLLHYYCYWSNSLLLGLPILWGVLMSLLEFCIILIRTTHPVGSTTILSVFLLGLPILWGVLRILSIFFIIMTTN